LGDYSKQIEFIEYDHIHREENCRKRREDKEKYNEKKQEIITRQIFEKIKFRDEQTEFSVGFCKAAQGKGVSIHTVSPFFRGIEFIHSLKLFFKSVFLPIQRRINNVDPSLRNQILSIVGKLGNAANRKA